MPNIFIDPHVFACPQPEEGFEQFQNYIDSIISWKEFKAAANWASIYISAQTAEVLAETNSYPPWDSLSNAITALNIKHVQAKDIVDLINSLLTKLPVMEDSFMIDDILVDNVICKPFYHVENRQPVFIEQYERLAVFVCFVLMLYPENILDQFLVTRYLNEDRCSIDVQGEVVAVDLSPHAGIQLPKCPFDINGNFWLCNTPRGLYLSVDPVKIWKKSSNPNGHIAAIEIYIYQMNAEAISPAPTDGPLWSLNNRFLDTARALGFLTEDKKVKNLLRACAETILNGNMKSTHALREGAGPEEAQQTRGSDKAWRRDIDYEYHLHYWETPTGPEFAAVVSHKDMSIPR